MEGRNTTSDSEAPRNSDFSTLQLEEEKHPSESRILQAGRPFIRYETLVWLVYGAITVLAIADRFSTNLWPRQVFRIGRGTAGSDFTDGLKAGPWSVKFYDIVARVSGRYSILALNLLLFTAMKTTESFLSESWISRRAVDFSDVHEANQRLHKWNGITLCVMTLVHVWSILTPVVFNGWAAKVVLGSFEWILSERTPPGFKDADPATKTMMLQGDDVFRIIEMTILLAVLMPLSIHWLSTRWHIGVQLHSVISVLYFIDIVRRHSHPHSWILNTPFFLFWVADIVVGMYWRKQTPDFTTIPLSRDYVVLLWNQSKRSSNTVGPKYYLRLKKHSVLERPHVFTAFENRIGLDMNNSKPWSVGIVVRVYHNARRPKLGKIDNISHTHRVTVSTDKELDTWGPFNGSMTQKINRSLHSFPDVTLVAGGSAVAYLLDGLQQAVPGGAKLSLVFTTRDSALFEWVLEWMASIVERKGAKSNISVLLALTGNPTPAGGALVQDIRRRVLDGADKDSEPSSASHTREESSRGSVLVDSVIRTQGERIDFESEFVKQGTVFFQGGGALQSAVGVACKKVGCRYVAGPAFDQDPSRSRKGPKLEEKSQGEEAA